MVAQEFSQKTVPTANLYTQNVVVSTVAIPKDSTGIVTPESAIKSATPTAPQLVESNLSRQELTKVSAAKLAQNPNIINSQTSDKREQRDPDEVCINPDCEQLNSLVGETKVFLGDENLRQSEQQRASRNRAW